MIVLPEPAPWASRFDGEWFAPWAMAWHAPVRLPSRVRDFVGRRGAPGARNVAGWWLLEAALRAWAGRRTERHLRTRFGLREATDHMAARLVRQRRPAMVVAPSCAAWRSFAAAREVGAKCILIQDLPDVRGLHDDLDRAAAAHPGCRFLRNYRAPARVMVRQEVERTLADEILVRGRFAEAQLAPRSVGVLEATSGRALTRRSRPGRPRVLLAGLAAARHGSVEALAVVERLPGIELLVRPGEGMEPANLLEHPRVSAWDGDAIDAVLAPAWVECYPAEVTAAAAAGIPVVGTARAAGYASIASCEPGDVGALAAALDRALGTR